MRRGRLTVVHPVAWSVLVTSDNDLDGFACLRCGRCCAVSGFVHVTTREIKQIANHLGISAAAVRRGYTATMALDGRKVEILRDHPQTTRCIFLDEQNQCRIHPVKPQQCQSFPLEWKRAGADLYCLGLQRLRQGKD